MSKLKDNRRKLQIRKAKKRYRATDKGKKKEKEYSLSLKGKKRTKKYATSVKGKQRATKYEQSVKGRERRRKYEQSVKGQQRSKKFVQKSKEKKKEETRRKNEFSQILWKRGRTGRARKQREESRKSFEAMMPDWWWTNIEQKYGARQAYHEKTEREIYEESSESKFGISEKEFWRDRLNF